MPDNHFVLQAAKAIRELERMILDNPTKANHRYAQLAEDVQAVLKRFLRGGHCRTCDKKTALPVIQHTVFCGDSCRHLDDAGKAQIEDRVQEAISEYITPEAQS
jgi:hypothetical protein